MDLFFNLLLEGFILERIRFLFYYYYNSRIDIENPYDYQPPSYQPNQMPDYQPSQKSVHLIDGYRSSRVLAEKQATEQKALSDERYNQLIGFLEGQVNLLKLQLEAQIRKKFVENLMKFSN